MPLTIIIIISSTYENPTMRNNISDLWFLSVVVEVLSDINGERVNSICRVDRHLVDIRIIFIYKTTQR
jgi:hypothetical protein